MRKDYGWAHYRSVWVSSSHNALGIQYGATTKSDDGILLLIALLESEGLAEVSSKDLCCSLIPIEDGKKEMKSLCL